MLTVNLCHFMQLNWSFHIVRGLTSNTSVHDAYWWQVIPLWSVTSFSHFQKTTLHSSGNNAHKVYLLFYFKVYFYFHHWAWSSDQIALLLGLHVECQVVLPWAMYFHGRFCANQNHLLHHQHVISAPSLAHYNNYSPTSAHQNNNHDNPPFLNYNYNSPIGRIVYLW